VVALLADVLFLIITMPLRRVDGNARCAAGALVALVVVRNGFDGFGLLFGHYLLRCIHRNAGRTCIVPGQDVAFCGRALPTPRKTVLVFPASKTGIAGAMSTSRHLVIALAIGGALCFAATPAAAQENDRLLLAAFCDLSNIVGSTCKKARLYPDAGSRACDVKLTKERYRGKYVADAPLLVIAYESGCEPHATDGGGAVVFELVADKYLFRSFQPGSQTHDCVTVPKDTQQDLLVCITGHIGQGILESGVAQFVFTRSFEQQIGISPDFLMTAEDTTGAWGANTVACKESSKYFGVSKLAAGPRPMTVKVNADYADAATIRAACGKKVSQAEANVRQTVEGRSLCARRLRQEGKVRHRSRDAKGRANLGNVVTRLDRVTQYAAASRLHRWRLWNTGSPGQAGR
jgi:hypothetical protein